MTCDETRTSLGVYVLGALEPHERTEYDGHLARCPACRDELAGVAGLPGLLSRLTLAQVTAQPPPAQDQPVGQLPPELLDRLLARGAGTDGPGRQPVPWRRRMAAVAAAVLLVGSVIGVAVHSNHDRAVPTVGVTDPLTHVMLRAAMHPRAWGTAIDLQLHGVTPGERCRLLAVDRDGHTEVAASWQATYEGKADLTAATAIPRAALVTLRVVAADDRQLVNLSIAP